jgi:hypothetical protein
MARYMKNLRVTVAQIKHLATDEAGIYGSLSRNAPCPSKHVWRLV